jgi:ectoine hydroxylase-related dioxygenase (phytanoyl-CoA dioxygenase family)
VSQQPKKSVSAFRGRMAAARRAAAYLFVNGSGQRAHRLVLQDRSGRDLGGWCQRAVANAIERELRAKG